VIAKLRIHVDRESGLAAVKIGAGVEGLPADAPAPSAPRPPARVKLGFTVGPQGGTPNYVHLTAEVYEVGAGEDQGRLDEQREVRRREEEAWARATASASVALQVLLQRCLRLDPQLRPALLEIVTTPDLKPAAKKRKVEAVLKTAEAEAELSNAAAKIQARIRGQASRKQASPERPQRRRRHTDEGAAVASDDDVMVAELARAKAQLAAMQSNVSRQCDELVKLKRDLTSAQRGRGEMRNELKRHLEETEVARKAADPWNAQMETLVLSGEPAKLKKEKHRLQADLQERLLADVSYQARQERSWLVHNAMRARRELQEAEELAARSRIEWTHQRQQHVIRSSEALAEARSNKEHARRAAAAAARDRFRQTQKSDDDFFRARREGMARSGSKPVLPAAPRLANTFAELRQFTMREGQLPAVSPSLLARSQSLQSLPREARGSNADASRLPQTGPPKLGKRVYAASVEPKLYSPLPGHARLSALGTSSSTPALPPLPKAAADSFLPPLSIVIPTEVPPL